MKRTIAALLIVGGACGGSDPAATSTSVGPTSVTSSTTAGTSVPASTVPPSSTTQPELLPPHEIAALAPLFQDAIAPFGYTITRAALLDLSNYQPSPEGNHLAFYLTPDTPFTANEMVLQMPGITRVFVPLVFTRWPELESFDFCQEEHGWEGDGFAPSQTIVTIDRAAIEGIDWEEFDLEALITASREREGFSVWGTAEIRESPAWAQAGGA